MNLVLIRPQNVITFQLSYLQIETIKIEKGVQISSLTSNTKKAGPHFSVLSKPTDQ